MPHSVHAYSPPRASNMVDRTCKRPWPAGTWRAVLHPGSAAHHLAPHPAYRRTVPLPPVRTEPAIFCNLSRFICNGTALENQYLPRNPVFSAWAGPGPTPSLPDVRSTLTACIAHLCSESNWATISGDAGPQAGHSPPDRFGPGARRPVGSAITSRVETRLLDKAKGSTILPKSATTPVQAIHAIAAASGAAGRVDLWS